MALAAETESNTDSGEVDAFGTPTIVHFCAVLLVSAILSMPWDSVTYMTVKSLERRRKDKPSTASASTKEP